MTNEIKEWFLMPSINSCLAEYEKQELGLIADIAKHGCAGGVPGLTYYSETASFYDEHETEIWAILTILKNDLVWFAVEVAAQELVNNLEEENRAQFDQQVKAGTSC